MKKTRRDTSWRVLAIGSFIGTVIHGGLPLGLSLVAALVAGVGSPEMARAAAWCIGGLSALCAAGLGAVAALTITGTPGETAFGVASLLLAPVLLAPVVLCVRRARSSDADVAEDGAARR